MRSLVNLLRDFLDRNLWIRIAMTALALYLWFYMFNHMFYEEIMTTMSESADPTIEALVIVIVWCVGIISILEVSYGKPQRNIWQNKRIDQLEILLEEIDRYLKDTEMVCFRTKEPNEGKSHV